MSKFFFQGFMNPLKFWCLSTICFVNDILISIRNGELDAVFESENLDLTGSGLAGVFSDLN